MPKTDPDPADVFSPIEEEFFRTGDAISAGAPGPWSEVEAAPPPTGVWSRLFNRSRRPATEPAAADDEWDQQIAIARARHVTAV